MTKKQTFQEILEKIRKESSNSRQLGTKFETLTLQFLRTDRHYKNQFTKVQTWKEWSEQNNILRRDEGIDLVATLPNGTFCGIQCKCYDDAGNINYKGLSTFLASCSSYKMIRPILVYTGDVITETAEYHLRKHGGAMITSDLLRASRIDWSEYPKLISVDPKGLRKYQENACNDVIEKFKKADRGKLIMACGTGKTLTSLRISEAIVRGGGLILYLVPSITLIQQSMREWSDNRLVEHEYMAVCSDSTVKGEDGTMVELESRVSTDSETLRQYMLDRDEKKTMVIFSTYNSVERVGDTMKSLHEVFDLALCDEAHRTVPGADESFYSYIHDDKNIPVKKRLYMTATPKVYGEAVVGKARRQNRQIIDMNDKDRYGDDFHRLSFSDAVHKYKALSDYRVVIAHIPMEEMSKKEQEKTDRAGLLELERITRMQVIWKAILKKDPDINKGFLQRVIVFHNRIKDSKKFAGELDSGNVTDFAAVVSASKLNTPTQKTAIAKHVDAQTKSLERKKHLYWLAQSDTKPNECRLLTNARCLSEGVDVPALDGVAFMEPRSSKVDVVQAVGRVMRKFGSKKYGYVILPVAVPAGKDPNDTLDKSDTWRVVWQVLNALRSHDNELEVEINQLALKKSYPVGVIAGKIKIMNFATESKTVTDIERLLHANITIKMLEKVGDYEYFDKYGSKLGKAAAAIKKKIEKKIKSEPEIKNAFDEFYNSLKNVVGNSITSKETQRVISQHMVLTRVFDSFFDGKFTSLNPISKEFDKIVRRMRMSEDVDGLDEFYRDVDAEIDRIGNDRMKRQGFIKKIYGNFFAIADKKDTEKHGVVYTPIEVIDFIINNVESLLRTKFNKSFGDKDVKILEPFAGTGTFISRLLESGYLGRNLQSKYGDDIAANELILLAHYISTINIETTYQSLRKDGKYVPFTGMAYVDTLEINPQHATHPEKSTRQKKLDSLLSVLDERIRKQREGKIDVIIGNPPYSGGQKSFDDMNPNVKYDALDKRIEDTYGKTVHGKSKNKLLDSYIRSIRWMSDRLNNSGIIGIVTNSSFLYSDATSGMRKSIVEEFNEIWCLDLRGNQRTKGELSKKEGGKIFGSGSRAPVVIIFLVKIPNNKNCVVYYKDIGDYLTRDAKLTKIEKMRRLNKKDDWNVMELDQFNDWLRHRDPEFHKYAPLEKQDEKQLKIVTINKKSIPVNTDNIFEKYSLGVSTNRDAWVYNSSTTVLTNNMRKHIEYCKKYGPEKPKNIDKKSAKWDATLTRKLTNKTVEFKIENIRTAMYRPFFTQKMYFDKTFHGGGHRMQEFFPKANSDNLIICVPDKFAGEFSTLMINMTADLEVIHHGQCFPLYTYDGKTKKDNILDSTLAEYQEHYKDKKITKKDVFYYIYGVLHHPGYRKKFENNLTRELPRIPMADDFEDFCNIGEQLANIHTNFKTCKQYDSIKPKFKIKKFTKLSFEKTKEIVNDKRKIIKYKSILKVDGRILYDNIPNIKYTVNGRTPLEWIVDRYKITVDDNSGITNDSCVKTDITPIITQMIHIGLESDRLIASLPKEFEPSNWTQKRKNLDAHMDAD